MLVPRKVMLRVLILTILFVPAMVTADEAYDDVSEIINKALPTGNFEHKLWYEAARKLKLPLESNRAWARYYASFLYTYGAGGYEQNYEKADEMGLSAAHEGFLPAMEDRARRNEYGLSGTIDFEKALMWYEKAALAGSRSAAARLEEVYLFGELGQKVDKVKAAKWNGIKGECGQP